MFVLAKRTSRPADINQLCRTRDNRLCVWEVEDDAAAYAAEREFDGWVVIPATSEHYQFAGSNKRNRHDRTRPCYVVMGKKPGKGEQPMTVRKLASAGQLVEVFEDAVSRRWAISSRASTEEEFLTELAEAMSQGKPAADAERIRLREMLPLVVDLCCKYRGYKVDKVVERRELVAGDLEMPRKP